MTMDKAGKTKLFFKGTSSLKLDMLGVRSNGKTIAFPTTHDKNVGGLTFKSWNQCVQFYKSIEEKMAIVKDFTQGEKVFKNITNVKRESLIKSQSEIPNEKWAKIQKFLLNPDKFEVSDFKSYDVWLCNNVLDRDRDRFTADVLKSLGKSLVGKSLLYGHDKSGVGDGIWYDTKILDVTVDDAIEHIGQVSMKGFKKHLEDIAEKEGSIKFLIASCYMLSSNPETEKVDAGIVRHASISFYAPNWTEVKDEDGNILYWEFRNTEESEAEAVEASFVYLGAQHGSTTKDPEVPAIKVPEKKPESKSPNNSQHSQEVKKMKFLVKGLKIEREIPEEDSSKDLQLLEFAINSSVDQLVQENEANKTKAETAENSLKEFKDVFDGVESAKAAKSLAEEFKAELVSETLKFGKLSGQVLETASDDTKKILEGLSIDELKVRKQSYVEAYNKANPANPSLGTDTTDKNHDQDDNGQPKGTKNVTPFREPVV